MSTQQVSSRTFRINYDGGFALANSTEMLNWLIENNRAVIVVETISIGQAYVDAANQFVHDEWIKNPYQQPILPRLEDLIKLPYRVSSFISQIPSTRFFASVSIDNIGIFDNVKNAVEFIDYFKHSSLKEFSTIDEAKLWLNEKFLLPIFAISAYVTEPIEYIKNLPLNSVVPIQYRQWWENNLPFVPNLPFVEPKFLSVPKED